jgi:anti-anti-sigma factor
MISIEKRDKVDIVSFNVDKINAFITDQIKDEIRKVVENGSSKVVINLKGVSYIDSSGFGCLLSVLRMARNNYCTLKLTSPEPGVLQVLHTLNLHTVFEIFDDLDTCVRSLR